MFWVVAILSVPSALGMIFVRKAVHSALLLAVVMLSLAAAYAAQDAPFLAFVQVIVYTGAVLMLFLFVLMLVGVSSTDSLVETIRGQRLFAAIAAIAFVVLLLVGFGHVVYGSNAGLKNANSNGNIQGLASLIFTKYVFAFEVTSALLITAALAAMVLTHRERTSPKATQKDLSMARFRSGTQQTPLPGPGVYARHNAVDMPALLPDGTASPLSVNPVLAARPEATSELHADLYGKTEQEAIDEELAVIKEIEG
jgi:NADH-quinone oxidoreductase subunit J